MPPASAGAGVCETYRLPNVFHRRSVLRRAPQPLKPDAFTFAFDD